MDETVLAPTPVQDRQPIAETEEMRALRKIISEGERGLDLIRRNAMRSDKLLTRLYATLGAMHRTYREQQREQNRQRARIGA
jgi:hypothetical protein